MRSRSSRRRHDVLATPAIARADVHVFDEAQHVRRAPRERPQAASTSSSFTPRCTTQLSLIAREARGLRGGDARRARRRCRPRPPDIAANTSGDQRIQAHRDAMQAGLAQGLRVRREQAAVGRQREVVERRRCAPGAARDRAGPCATAARRRSGAACARPGARSRAPASRFRRRTGATPHRARGRRECDRPACSTGSGSCTRRSPTGADRATGGRARRAAAAARASVRRATACSSHRRHRAPWSVRAAITSPARAMRCPRTSRCAPSPALA